MSARTLLLLAGLVGALAPPAAFAAPATPRLLPVDEATRFPDFFSFRAALQAAIARRDTTALLAAVDPHVKIGFGADNGIDAFRAQWRLDDPQCALWQELGSVLALGGSFRGDDAFDAPYVFSRWPQAYDAFEHVAVVAARVRVREAASADARVLAQVDFAILAVGRDGTDGGGRGGDGWTPVRLPDGRAGFVASHLVKSPVGYRAIFGRKGVGWKLMAFVAGD